MTNRNGEYLPKPYIPGMTGCTLDPISVETFGVEEVEEAAPEPGRQRSSLKKLIGQALGLGDLNADDQPELESRS